MEKHLCRRNSTGHRAVRESGLSGGGRQKEVKGWLLGEEGGKRGAGQGGCLRQGPPEKQNQ